MPTTRTFKPDPAALYFTDNGCVLCGQHLGASALYTGRDISGQPIQRVTLADVRAYRLNGCDLPDLSCESCGKGFVGAEPRVAVVEEVVPEFRVTDHGTVWTFTALTDDAWRFVQDELFLESWQQTGRYSFAVDHRPAAQLARDLADRGFTLQEA